MHFDHIQVPEDGSRITVEPDHSLRVPDVPIIPFIEGDGIGPEVTGATVEILAAAGAPIDWERIPAGMAAFEQCGAALPDAGPASLRTHPAGPEGPGAGQRQPARAASGQPRPQPASWKAGAAAGLKRP